MTSNTNPKTVVLKGRPFKKELEAAGTITPGMLVERNSSNEVQAHGTAAGAASPIFACEADYAGTGIDTDYTAGLQVQMAYGSVGDEFYALLEDEGNVAVGALLESAGDGSLQALSGSNPVARAIEAVDNTGGTGAVRIKVEAL